MFQVTIESHGNPLYLHTRDNNRKDHVKLLCQTKCMFFVEAQMPLGN